MKSLDRIPSSVYRVQLSQAFPLQKLLKLLPYLQDLGVEGIYCSPIFQAQSDHGYDILDPRKLEPRLGTLEDLFALRDALQDHKMHHILDIVPNHMGILSPWWRDVMAYGPHSSYAPFFDIEWKAEKKELEGKVLLPILGKTYGTALDEGDIALIFEENEFQVRCGSHSLPLSIASYALLFKALSTLNSEQESILRSLHSLTSENLFVRDKIEEWKKGFYIYLQAHAEPLLQILSYFKAETSAKNHLHELLEKQYYRLSHWLVASQEINYRRFFYVNDLAALCIEKEKIFITHHAWIQQLVEEKLVDGLRVDHPDGLLLPAEYFEKIAAFNPSLIVIEKILGKEEKLPENWKIDGTVGYEFLNILNELYINSTHGPKLTRIYERFLGKSKTFASCKELIVQKKKIIIYSNMAAEVNALGLYLSRFSEKNRYTRDFTRADLTRALGEIIAHFPIYRTYIVPEKNRVSPQDAHAIYFAIEKAKINFSRIDPLVFDYIRDLLLLQSDRYQGDKVGRDNFVLRFQQLTAPIMAKGYEDTFLFTYNNFLSLNEVGGDPCHFGSSLKRFHLFNEDKQEKWPLGFLPSSTHDTKRSEDVRTRLNVLSEIPERWQQITDKWKTLNAPLKSLQEGNYYPEANTEYYIYQTLVGIWPTDRAESSTPGFQKRVLDHLLKAIRESKSYTSWNYPHLVYEQAVHSFVTSLFTHTPFLDSFLPFQEEIAHYGFYNSLSLTAVKLGCPGIVDIYQGAEELFFALTDPDNRTPLALDEVQKRHQRLLETPSDILTKLFLYQKILPWRRQHKELFLKGSYLPLRVQGEKKEHLIAFQREWEEQKVIVLSARFFTNLFPFPEKFHPEIFKDHALLLSSSSPEKWQDIISEKICRSF